MNKVISLKEVIGKGYADVYNALHNEGIRYLAIKGSRASKKSKTIALFLILLLLENTQTNILVIRRFEKTLKDSCYAELRWACDRLGVVSDFVFLSSPREIRRVSTGQVIFFRGLDDPYKITSLAVMKGCLPYVWLEEAYEIENHDKFKVLEGSIRGQMPKGISAKFIFTFNPWRECWLKTEFFDTKQSNIFSKTTNYLCNEFLSENDLKWFNSLKKNYPKRYAIEGLGSWGQSDGLVFTNVHCENIDVDNLRSHPAQYKAFYGLDFGFTDPTGFVGGFVDRENKTIYITMELYLYNVTNLEISKAIKELGIKGERVICDSAEPKSIEELRRYGINAVACQKGPNSVLYGIQKIQNFKIIYDPTCENFGHEISNYAWKIDSDGKSTNKPDHAFSHLMDATRYGLQDIKIEAAKIAPSNLAYMRSRRR